MFSLLITLRVPGYTRREEELDRKEAALAHRAVVLEAELKRLNGAATYTSAQVRDLVRANLSNRQRRKNG